MAKPRNVEVGQVWYDAELDRKFVITAQVSGVRRNEPAWSVEMIDKDGKIHPRPIVYESTIRAKFKIVYENQFQPQPFFSRLSKVK